MGRAEKQLPVRKRSLTVQQNLDPAQPTCPSSPQTGYSQRQSELPYSDQDKGKEQDVDGMGTMEEDQEEDEEYVGDEDEEEYRLQFQGDMDPLAFAEEDNQGNLPYQLFERLESEALAAREAERRKRGDATSYDTRDDSEQVFGASLDEIWDAAGLGQKRRKKGERKKGRRKLPPGAPPGSSRLAPEVSRKLGDANLLYATGKFDEAVDLLKEVIRLAPNVSDSYHTLGLLYDAMGDRKKALNFYMIAAHLTPKDTALWKRLASWSTEQGNIGQVIHCLTKAIRADPEDIDAKWDRAMLYADLQDYQKAAEAFAQILVSRPNDVEVCKMAAKMQRRNGQPERAVQLLGEFIDKHPKDGDLTVVNLLAEMEIERQSFLSAIEHIERARIAQCVDHVLPLDLAVKAGICHAHLGNIEIAERYFEELKQEGIEEYADLILEVADAYLALEKHQHALKYYLMLEEDSRYDTAELGLKLAECHYAVGAEEDAIRVYYTVMDKIPEHIEARLTLASLLSKNGRQDAAYSLLEPPSQSPDSPAITTDNDFIPWWKHGRIKIKLAEMYYLEERIAEYVEAILPSIQESLYAESVNQKVRSKKRLPKSVLSARAKALEKNADEVFYRPGSFLSQRDRAKALRARKKLDKLAAEREVKRAAALAAGVEWESEDDSDTEPMESEMKVPPLPNLLKDEEHYQIFIQTCKALVSLNRYWEALEIIHHFLKVAQPNLIPEKRDELRTFGAQIAYKRGDVNYGYECARYMVQQRPYSLNMWNCYYQVVTRSETKVPRHHKFMLQMRHKYPDCVPAMVICGHQFAMISQSQGALREYLQAYKENPDDPFINLVVGVNFINLSQGFRLSNRNQCVLQGFAFLYNYQRLSNDSQESNYNIARAYHCIGLPHLAVNYYEKVLEQFERDRSLLSLPYESSDFVQNNSASCPEASHSGYCDLRREAAHNLHLIYTKSGAYDLARQVLMDHCRP